MEDFYVVTVSHCESGIILQNLYRGDKCEDSDDDLIVHMLESDGVACVNLDEYSVDIRYHRI